MKELLEEFVRLSPEEWEVDDGPGTGTDFSIYDFESCETIFVDLTRDHGSGEAIIFLWDYLGGRGCWSPLEPLFSIGGGKPCQVCGYRYLGKLGAHGDGKTRIEALVRACVAVWRQNEPREN